MLRSYFETGKICVFGADIAVIFSFEIDCKNWKTKMMNRCWTLSDTMKYETDQTECGYLPKRMIYDR